jgi:hypothetical protein
MLLALLTSIHPGDYSLLQILAQKTFNGFHGSMTLIVVPQYSDRVTE